MGFKRLRIAIYVSAGVVSTSFLASILTDTLIAPNISDNWYEAATWMLSNTSN